MSDTAFHYGVCILNLILWIVERVMHQVIRQVKYACRNTMQEAATTAPNYVQTLALTNYYTILHSVYYSHESNDNWQPDHCQLRIHINN